MKELLKILEELRANSASGVYNKFKLAGEILKLKDVNISILDGSFELEDTLTEGIAERIEIYPERITFSFAENGNNEVYFANINNKEILLVDCYTDKGIQRVKDAINNYYAQNPKSDSKKRWTFKEERV